MELFVIFVIIFVIIGARWIYQTVRDIFKDINRSNWDNRVYGQVASSRSVRRGMGDHDLGALRRAFGQFAEKYDGQVHDRQPFESPKVSFNYKNSRVLLSIYESSDSPPQFFTQLTFTIPPGWSHRIEIFPQRFKDMDVKYLNVDDIQIGDPQFDPRYVIKSNDQAFIKEFLDAPVKNAVEELRGLRGNDKIILSVNSSRMMVRKHSILQDPAEIDRFAEKSLVVYDRIYHYLQKLTGIEIVDDKPEEGVNPCCQVCGVEIPSDNRIYCRRCKTPHHQECWEFNNATCSTYACGEKRFVEKY